MVLRPYVGLILCFLICVISRHGVESWWWGKKEAQNMGDKISDKAREYIGSTKWAFANSKWPLGANTNKCNLFVANVIEEAGGSVPHRYKFYTSPIGANEWGNEKSTYLTNDTCWKLCSRYSTKKGDVLAHGGHVGIVTGSSKTTSAAHDNVVENDWGFRSGQTPTCWRYSC